ncbi:type II secretion system protein GspD [Erwinia psidii]|nr:type II secretion system protein GspD [Erwinia psidii]
MLKINSHVRMLTLLTSLLLTGMSGSAIAEGLSANFKNTDIHEFINTVSANLNKTIIIDPSVQGAISVRSYEQMDNEQYYQFFLSVLSVYGYAVVTTPNGALKVLPERNAKSAGIRLLRSGEIPESDEIIVRITPLRNISGRELAPLLRQLNNAAEGSIIYYDPANVILMTGRASVVNQLVSVIKDVDEKANFQVETLHLNNASATDVASLAMSLYSNGGGENASGRILAHVVADERTNSILITGDEPARKKMIATLKKLDEERGALQSGNTRVIYLEYAKAKNLLNVLSGITSSKSATPNESSPLVISSGTSNEVSIKADEETNSLIITGPQHLMNDMQEVIAKLDIRRAQVLVEAIIVEVSDAEGLNFGIQWMNTYAGGTNFSSTTGGSVTTIPDKGIVNSLSGLSGLATGFYRGNWAGLVTALQTNSQSNILATPSIVTLDNMEAEFTVGQEVPVLTGSQTTSGDNVYNTVERKSVGIKLKVTPQINRGDSVMLSIEQEVSSVSDSATNNDLGPTFDTRVVRNAVLVGTGNTVVVGGLLDTSNNHSENKVPLLGRIPILKYLFGATSKKVNKRNLMLFIRPTIIREQDEFNRVSQQSRGKFNQHDLKTAADHQVEQILNQETGLPGSANELQQVLGNINAFYAGQSR